jgi:hypothetical protein
MAGLLIEAPVGEWFGADRTNSRDSGLLIKAVFWNV